MSRATSSLSRPFLAENEALVAQLERLQAKLRRRDLLVPDYSRYEFYDRRVPPDVYDGPTSPSGFAPVRTH